MKFFHLSDMHIGKQLHRYREHRSQRKKQQLEQVRSRFQVSYRRNNKLNQKAGASSEFRRIRRVLFFLLLKEKNVENFYVNPSTV